MAADCARNIAACRRVPSPHDDELATSADLRFQERRGIVDAGADKAVERLQRQFPILGAGDQDNGPGLDARFVGRLVVNRAAGQFPPPCPSYCSHVPRERNYGQTRSGHPRR